MISCRDVAREATEHLEGAMPWWRRLAFRVHLALCAACAAFVAQLRATRELLARVGRAEAPPAAPPAALLRALRDRRPPAT